MNLPSNEFIVSYGSLLSHDSRQRFSGFGGALIPVTIVGMTRHWTTRYDDEFQTYVGATHDSDAVMNAALALTPTVTPELRKRERYYDISPVDLADLILHVDETERDELTEALRTKKLWICESKKLDPANREYPFVQTYVDTCLVGCLETGVDRFAHNFVETTKGWETGWCNDRESPRYPRAARVDKATQQKIDQILEECDVLRFRND